jgi:hypothetical protein
MSYSGGYAIYSIAIISREILKQDSLVGARVPVANRPFSHDCISFQPARNCSGEFSPNYSAEIDVDLMIKIRTST